MEACGPPLCWHFGASQGSSSGMPRPWQCQEPSPSELTAPLLSPQGGNACLQLQQLGPAAAAAHILLGSSRRPWAGGSLGTWRCQELGHSLQVQPCGDRDMGCCWLGLSPPAWHLFSIMGCFWPTLTLHFGVALGKVPSHDPVSQSTLLLSISPGCHRCRCCAHDAHRLGLVGDLLCCDISGIRVETCCSLRDTCAKPPSHTRRAASYWKVFNWAL